MTGQATFYNIQYEWKFIKELSLSNLGQVIDKVLWGENLGFNVNLKEHIENTQDALF